jgi:hypothetical protein
LWRSAFVKTEEAEVWKQHAFDSVAIAVMSLGILVAAALTLAF